MTSQTFTATVSTYRIAGRAAIASGIIGIIAYGFLVVFLASRGQTFDFAILMQRCHDLGVSLQFLLMVPAVFGLHKLSQQLSPGISRLTLNIGVGALLCTALFLLLIFPELVSDGLYSLPQGVFGVWLIVVNLRLPGVLTRGLRWFGIVVGLGLTIVGMTTVGYAIFVSTLILQIPAAPLEEIIKIPMTTANHILHYFIWIGGFMGMLPLPFWTLLLGRRLLREVRQKDFSSSLK